MMHIDRHDVPLPSTLAPQASARHLRRHAALRQRIRDDRVRAPTRRADNRRRASASVPRPPATGSPRRAVLAPTWTPPPRSLDRPTDLRHQDAGCGLRRTPNPHSPSTRRTTRTGHRPTNERPCPKRDHDGRASPTLCDSHADARPPRACVSRGRYREKRGNLENRAAQAPCGHVATRQPIQSEPKTSTINVRINAKRCRVTANLLSATAVRRSRRTEFCAAGRSPRSPHLGCDKESWRRAQGAWRA